MKNHNRKLTHRGIVTISLLATLVSVPISYMLYVNEYTTRLAYNQNYNGNAGGELFIPFIVYILTYIILNKFFRKSKYDYR